MIYEKQYYKKLSKFINPYSNIGIQRWNISLENNQWFLTMCNQIQELLCVDSADENNSWHANEGQIPKLTKE